MVPWRIAGQAFQGIDPAESGLEMAGPRTIELVDGPGKPVGELALLSYRGLCTGGIQRSATDFH